MEQEPVRHEKKAEAQYPEIAAELTAMVDAEQKMRRGWEEGVYLEEDEGLDERNTERLKAIIEQIDWPTVSKVGEEASHMAWLLAQHADHDPDFQRQCLALLKDAPPGEIQLKEIGYLDDRIRFHEGRPQLYGTQFTVSEDGVFGPAPIEDIEHLDERRASLDMGSFAGYAKGMYELNKDVAAKKQGEGSQSRHLE